MTTEHIFLAVIGAAGFWEIIKLVLTRIFKKKDKHDDKEDLQTLALQGLLHEALERRCLEALAIGQMTPAMHETSKAKPATKKTTKKEEKVVTPEEVVTTPEEVVITPPDLPDYSHLSPFGRMMAGGGVK